MTSAAALRRRLNRQKGQCTWCGEQVPKGRRTWCSPECVESFRQENDWAFARSRVEKRDRGVCATCGLDTNQLKRICRHALNSHRQAGVSYHDVYRHLADWLESVGMRPLVFGAQWEADHIVPRVRGGGNELPNLRTLCLACHKRETARLAAERAAERRDADRPLMEATE